MEVQVQKPKSKSYSGSSGTYSGPYCSHRGMVQVFNLALPSGKRITILGGAKRDLDFHGIDLYLDLTGSPKKSLGKFFDFSLGSEPASPLFQEFLDIEKTQEAYTYVPPTISLKWPDRGVLQVHLDFWADLWDSVVRFAEARDEVETTLIVSCEGGHGRTGTALAVLGLISGALKPEKSLIKRIRSLYCEKAIESKTQKYFLEDFIEELFPQLEGFYLEDQASDDLGSLSALPVDPREDPLPGGSWFRG